LRCSAFFIAARRKLSGANDFQNGEAIRQTPQIARIDIAQFRETAGLPQLGRIA
jgi:hypothetical protein